MSPKFGQCYLNPPVPQFVLNSKSGLPGTVSIRPQVNENDFCDKIVIEH